ncbi:hypothetical protein ACFQZI_10395 [Mucilaginibacter lutimaris]|uniref:Lipoprotein n=1 Tax=Mucilaginibacter lutimaris TaxID=931629 RepID=A0ABW2ZGE5_9SPHI
MKRNIAGFILICLLHWGCSKPSSASQNDDGDCGTYKSGQQLFSGPKGGCYYYSSGGNKEYVERSACKCGL